MRNRPNTFLARPISHASLIASLCLSAMLLLMPYSGYAASTTKTDGELYLRTELKTHLLDLQKMQTPSDLGSSFSNPEALAGRIVLVTFFASWCPPCMDEFKALNQVQDAIGSENIFIVAVNVFEEFDDNDEARMDKFLHTTDPKFTVVKGTDKTRELFGNINRIPTLLLFDKNGEQAFNFVHVRNSKKRSAESDELLNAIRPLL